MPTRRSMILFVAAAALLAACGKDTGVSSGDANGGTVATTSAGASTIPGETTTTAEATTTTTTTAATTTVPETTVPPTTLPATTAAPPPTLPPAVTTPPPVLTPLPPDTNLQPDAAVSVVVPSGANFCDFVTPPGWVTQTCEAIVADQVKYALVQREAGDGHFRVVVMVPSATPGGYESEFIAEEPGAGVWDSVTVLHGSFHFGEGPFNGDAEGLWVGYRYVGTGAYLDLDVVEWYEDGSARRGALKSLDHGAVDVRPGGADVLSAVFSAGDPGCCPSQFLRQEISWVSDWWHIDAGVLVPAGAPGAIVDSDF